MALHTFKCNCLTPLHFKGLNYFYSEQSLDGGGFFDKDKLMCKRQPLSQYFLQSAIDLTIRPTNKHTLRQLTCKPNNKYWLIIDHLYLYEIAMCKNSHKTYKNCTGQLAARIGRSPLSWYLV